jgi:uncharacterized protein with ParB-like and HNH nuclease domain
VVIVGLMGYLFGSGYMKSETMSVRQLFQDRRQYRVPFFQRPYVWNKEDQWERLWNDIADKAEVRIDGDEPSPHFLGAAVLEPQQRKGLLGVESSNIIDGQQRFTTLQYFLAALTIVLRQENQAMLLALAEACLWNDNVDTMQQPDIEIFKVWPTFRDRSNFQLAMKADSLDELREFFPQSFTQSGTLKKIGIDHPPSLEAIWFFADQISEWASEDTDGQKSARLTAMSEAILRDLRLVSISLGDDDDAQVIFETLNGHGAELHATDLIRNFIFMRADRDGVDGHKLFETYWTQFENSFWAEDQRRGRLIKPRMEWFLQSALQAALGDEVEIGRLYTNYRSFALPKGTPIKAAEQLQMLDGYAGHYRKLISGVGDDPIAVFGRRAASWDTSTAHPLALRIASCEASSNLKMEMYNDIISYFIRRAICGLPTKNYNKVFLQLLKNLSTTELTAESLRAALAAPRGDTSRWPRDEEFRRAWSGEAVYPGRLDAQRIKAILAEIESGMRSARSEEPLAGDLESLDVDHILPASWFEYWELPDGTKTTASEAAAVHLAFLSNEELSTHQLAIRRREEAKATIGNLTLIHYGINRGLHNREFLLKREKFFAESNLHLNRTLMRLEKWDEADIAARGQAMFDVALKLWRGPKT